MDYYKHINYLIFLSGLHWQSSRGHGWLRWSFDKDWWLYNRTVQHYYLICTSLSLNINIKQKDGLDSVNIKIYSSSIFRYLDFIWSSINRIFNRLSNKVQLDALNVGEKQLYSLPVWFQLTILVTLIFGMSTFCSNYSSASLWHSVIPCLLQLKPKAFVWMHKRSVQLIFQLAPNLLDGVEVCTLRGSVHHFQYSRRFLSAQVVIAEVSFMGIIMANSKNNWNLLNMPCSNNVGHQCTSTNHLSI